MKERAGGEREYCANARREIVRSCTGWKKKKRGHGGHRGQGNYRGQGERGKEGTAIKVHSYGAFRELERGRRKRETREGEHAVLTAHEIHATAAMLEK